MITWGEWGRKNLAERWRRGRDKKEAGEAGESWATTGGWRWLEGGGGLGWVL